MRVGWIVGVASAVPARARATEKSLTKEGDIAGGVVGRRRVEEGAAGSVLAVEGSEYCNTSEEKRGRMRRR